MKPWRILADDLTGALDTAAAWAGAGEVPVFLDAPGTSEQAVQVVATGTRDVPHAALAQRLAPSLDWFTASGHAFKKIDSLLRGNSFAEIAWLMQSARFEGAVFAPAFPAQGRFTAQGRHWVAPPHQPGGPRTHEHPVPLQQDFSALGLAAQFMPQVPEHLPAGGGIVIPDILHDHDLDRLALLAASPQARHWLWCGSAGLAWALVRQNPAPAARAASCAAPLINEKTPSLLLTASRHPVLREQLHLLAVQGAPVELIDLADHQPLAPAEAQARLAQRMCELVAYHSRPAALLVIGGDTLLALCRAANVHSLRACSSPRPGWGLARLVGGVWDGLLCYSRSGAFGQTDDLCALLAMLTPSRHVV